MMSRTCACRIDGAWKNSPAAAVPVRTKMPEPIIAPIPSAVRDHGAKRLLQALTGRLRFGNQLIDGLATEDLALGGANDFFGRRLGRYRL